MERIRTFICIEITNPEIRNKIKKIQKEFKSLEGRIKSTEEENIHITLKFLGDISIQSSKKISELLDSVKFSSFKLNLQGIGCFPSPSRPRIVWVGAKTGSDQIKEIYTLINSQLKNFHFKPDKFHSHITISRIKYLDRSNINEFKKLLDSVKNTDFGTIEISSFQFKKSVLTPKGPIYSILKDFKSN